MSVRLEGKGLVSMIVIFKGNGVCVLILIIGDLIFLIIKGFIFLGR